METDVKNKLLDRLHVAMKRLGETNREFREKLPMFAAGHGPYPTARSSYPHEGLEDTTTLKFARDHIQAGTGKIVTYTVDYELEDTTGNWSGEIMLSSGMWHRLAGGVLTNVNRRTIGQAVNLALNAEIDSLDIDALNMQSGD